MRRLMGALAATTGMALVLLGGLPANAADDGADLAGLEYVSLGDSYQAGFGLIPYSSTSPFAGDPNGCFQGEANYPHGVAAALGLTLDDQTCSGAITANLGYGAATVPATPTNVILPSLPTGSEQQTTMTGLLAPQVQTAALSASTDIVTVGIGGNDLGFSSIATSCMRLTLDTDPAYLEYEVGAFANCQDYFDDATTYPSAYLPGRLTDVVQPRLAAAFAQIRAAAPNAQVFVVGYPQIAPADATDACYTDPDTTDAVPFSGTDIRFIHEVESQLDALIQTEAADHAFHFIPTWEQTSAHTLCSSDPWIWGLTAYVNLVSSTCDAGYIPADADAWVCLKLGALHPNPGGVAEIESIVQQTLAGIMRVEVTSGTAMPGGSATVEGGGHAPGEAVELRLAGQVLARVTADAFGAFSTTIPLPDDLDAGEHPLDAVGMTSQRTFTALLGVDPAPAAPTPTPTASSAPEPAPAGSADPPELAASGADAAGTAALGGILVLLGALLVRRGRAAPQPRA